MTIRSIEAIRKILGRRSGTRSVRLVQAVDAIHYDAIISTATWGTLVEHGDLAQAIDVALTAAGYRFITSGQPTLGLPSNQAPVVEPVWPPFPRSTP